jgi:hypothetical protein
MKTWGRAFVPFADQHEPPGAGKGVRYMASGTIVDIACLASRFSTVLVTNIAWNTHAYETLQPLLHFLGVVTKLIISQEKDLIPVKKPEPILQVICVKRIPGRSSQPMI